MCNNNTGGCIPNKSRNPKKTKDTIRTKVCIDLISRGMTSSFTHSKKRFLIDHFILVCLLGNEGSKRAKSKSLGLPVCFIIN